MVTMARRGPAGRGCLPHNSARPNSSSIVSTRKTPTLRNAASRYVVAAGKRSCVRCGCFSGRSSPAHFDNYDWFGERNLAHNGQKRARRAHRLHVKQNAARVGIVAEMINKIAPVHISHGTDGNERAEPELGRSAPIENRRAKRAALSDEPYVARQRERLGECRVQTDVRQHHANAIRPNDPHLPASLENLLFKLCPSRPGFFEPAEIITAPFTPAVAHSATIPGTLAAGVAITARSTFSGASRIVENVFCPRGVQ